jgi:Pyruvate/2-oxoacid:ferredoxin oxidoreductase delta subunit
VNWRRWQPLIKPSTLEFARQARLTSNFNSWDWLHGYIYARWPYLYIGIGTGEHWLAKVFGPPLAFFLRLMPKVSRDPESKTGVADTYHGKVVPLDTARQLVTVDEEICIDDLEHVIPYPTARALILQNPDHIAVMDCPCRVARAEPCLPLDVCLLVGEPFASFVIEHHPRRARWITADQAVQILKEEDERGHAHHAFFKDAMLGRFYAICNCCSCCCGAIQAHRNGTPMLASSGYIACVDQDLCSGCETCTSYCQFQALSLSPNYTAQVDAEACMGCGVCTSKCPNDALSMQRVPEKGIPLEIEKLLEQAVYGTEESEAILVSITKSV